MTDAPDAPCDLEHYELAWDGNLGRVLLFGGERLAGGLSDATWAWDGGSWTRLDVPDRPAPRRNFAMTWDPESGRVLLVGGAGPGARVSARIRLDCRAVCSSTTRTPGYATLLWRGSPA